MVDRSSLHLSRRGFLATVGAGAVSVAMDVHAAPVLSRHRNRSVGAANSWLEVDPAVFERNIDLVGAMLAGGARCCAVMKADGYGAGIDALMPSVIRARIGYVAMSSNDEARIARARGYRGKLMRVRPASEREMHAARRYQVEELVGSVEAARTLSRMAGRRDFAVHLALNSAGMSRSGIELRTDGGRRDLAQLLAFPGLRVVGLMTHFPVEDAAEVREGLASFMQDVDWILSRTSLRREDVLLHAASSFALQNVPEAHLDMVRVGGALYGYSGTPKPPFGHVVSFKTRVASIQAYPAGRTVSYDRTFALERDALLANLPVGYSDGYGRAFSNTGQVLVRGKRAPVVGKVTMNSTMVDVTDIAGVIPGDEVVLFGRQGDEQLIQTDLQQLSGLGLAEQYAIWGALNPRWVLER